MAMHAAALRAELRIPAVRSLKEKRHRLRMVTTDLRRSFPAIGISEVDHQDQWQRTTIGVVAVAPQAGHLQRLLHSIQRQLEARPDVEVLEVGISHLERP